MEYGLVALLVIDWASVRIALWRRRKREVIYTRAAHDLSSPIMTVRHFMEEMRRSGNFPGETKHLCEWALQQISDISNDVLSAKLFYSEGRNTLSWERVNAVLEEVISGKRYELEGVSGVRIDFEPGVGEGNFRGGELKLQRILSNLLNNAVEACGNSGRIQLRSEGGDRGLIISLEDNGKGFDPFVKGVNSFGVGLGSAVEWIEAWGGSLDVVSNLGKGTLVSLKLAKA